MGCCVSSNRAPSSASSPRKHQNSQVGAQPPRSSSSSRRAKASESRAPPPVEEETVKEVLSETPKWKPAIAKLEPEKPPQKPAFEKFREESKSEKILPINKAEEISEVSEVYSLSESMSTTTITDRRDEEEEIRQRVNASPAKMRKNPSFSGDFGAKKERTVGKSPTRRWEQSPSRGNMGSAKPIQSRDQLGQRMGNRAMRNDPHRRDPGENSGRRSRSPATRTDNGGTRSIVGRSPSARRTNQSPARARTGPPESGNWRKKHPSTEGKWPSAANESLENPLVSLECFIFL